MSVVEGEGKVILKVMSVTFSLLWQNTCQEQLEEGKFNVGSQLGDLVHQDGEVITA